MSQNTIQTNSTNDHLLATEKKIPEYNPNNSSSSSESKSTWHWFQVTLACAIKICLSIIAVILSWRCNEKNGAIIRILISALAFFFSEVYILYYAIYRIYMGNKCPL